METLIANDKKTVLDHFKIRGEVFIIDGVLLRLRNRIATGHKSPCKDGCNKCVTFQCHAFAFHAVLPPGRARPDPR